VQRQGKYSAGTMRLSSAKPKKQSPSMSIEDPTGVDNPADEL